MGLCYTFCRTEQKTAGAFRHFAPPGGGRNVKREAGADPARSRHCDKGVHCQGAFAPVTEPSGLGRRQRALIFQSGNLPAVGTGALLPQITRNWLYQKACKIRGLFALPFRKQKTPFFQVYLKSRKFSLFLQAQLDFALNSLEIHKGFLRLFALNPACACEIFVIFFVFRHTLASLSCTFLFGAVFYPYQERKTK